MSFITFEGKDYTDAEFTAFARIESLLRQKQDLQTTTQSLIDDIDNQIARIEADETKIAAGVRMVNEVRQRMQG